MGKEVGRNTALSNDFLVEVGEITRVREERLQRHKNEEIMRE